MNRQQLDELRRASERNVKKENERKKFIKKYGKELENDYHDKIKKGEN